MTLLGRKRGSYDSHFKGTKTVGSLNILDDQTNKGRNIGSDLREVSLLRAPKPTFLVTSLRHFVEVTIGFLLNARLT